MPDAPSPVRGDSALLVPIPEAESIVADLRLRHDPAATHGVPAHVTVLYPFVPAAQIDGSLHDALTQLFGGTAGFAYRFERADRFDGTTVFLAPDTSDRFRALTDAVEERWPEHPPYGGVYAEVVPHLTVGDGLAGGAADPLHEAIADRLVRYGPVTGRASEIWLMTEDFTGRWSTIATYALAADAR
jgi:hypothetical protein